MKQGTINKYYVGLDGIISGIDGDWNIFSGVHCNSTKSDENLIGKNIFKMIKGKNVVKLYKDIHSRLDENPEKKLNFRIRCDSSSSYRLFSMKVRKQNNFIEYCVQLDEEKSLRKAIRLDYNYKDENSITICAWCKNFKKDNKSDEWLPVEQIFDNAPESFQINQDICPSCRLIIDKELSA